MTWRQPCRVVEHRGATAGGTDTAADVAKQCGGGALPRMADAAASGAGFPGSAQRAIGVQSQSLASAVALRREADSATASAPRTLSARPELDSDRIGAYMRDAIKRGGYREALEYYGSDEAKESCTERRRLRARGWLLGRLGLYDQVGDWLEEATALPDFDYLSNAAAGPAPRTAYRTPPLWMETPRPVQYSAVHTLTVAPAPAPCPDIGAVPDYVWIAMLILDAAGPICSRAGLGAAVHLVEAGADRRAHGQARGGRCYDPLRGARLHGAPEGCHRWIIADINFDPWPVNKAHYYYDLTDEGRRALKLARAAGAPWPRETEAAASGLKDMSLSDLLEGACKLGISPQNLDKIQDDLAKIYSAWEEQERGTVVTAVSAEDRALVDLGAAVMRPGVGGCADAALDSLLHLMTIVRAVRRMAREAEPHSRAERAVLEALIGAIQAMCRRHGGEAAASLGAPLPNSASHPPPAEGECALPPPLYADATPALITDLYYCLAEYCRSRHVAVDLHSLPPCEQLTEDERAAMSEAIAKYSQLHGDAA